MQAIGRFKVGKKLGAGSQGVVYLCLDPNLQRKVAIKLLGRTAASSQTHKRGSLREARAVSQIQHPNIVSVFDSGEYQGHPYLVFEYVEGELLSRSLAKGELELQQALDLFSGMLSGVDQVHQRGIVHRDLKPSNIIISRDGTPKIMDFGVARDIDSADSIESLPTGSSRYLAPEFIIGGDIASQADIFSLGGILFEMLTGRQAFDGSSRKLLLENIVKRAVVAPSTLNPEVGHKLDAIVLKALDKRPSARYRSAGEFLSALLEYREHAAAESSQASKGTVEFLVRRMQHKSDFPVLAESIRTLNHLSSSEDEDTARLASVIIRDFALTNKILRVVNSAYYSRFAGKIGSVSRAIVVLGIKPIRSIAASLIFFEHLHNRTQAAKLKDEIAEAIFSATLAKQVAEDAGMEDVEGSFLCGMLHNLGRILVTYYLDDESAEIDRLTSQERMSPEPAQMRVLGMSFEQIGIAIAKQWNFPKEITQGMVRVDPAAAGNLNNPDIKRRLIASFANEAAATIGSTETDEENPYHDLIKRYRNCLAISESGFKRMLADARSEFQELSGSLATGSGSRLLKRLAIDPAANSSAAKDEDRVEGLNETLILQPDAAGGDEHAAADISRGLPSPDAEAILTEGLQEVTGMLLEENCNINQLFNVVLETVYRAMAFEHILLSLHDVGRKRYVARLGFGSEIESFMAGFSFPDRYSANVFHAALKNGVDLYIEDTGAAKIRSGIPEWYRRLTRAGSFLLFPLVVSGKPLGLIYADHPQPKGLGLSGGQLNLLKALRNQVILAFRARA